VNLKQTARRSGVALFAFFTVKGLLWLIVPALIALFATGTRS